MYIFASEHRAAHETKKSIIFQFIVTDKVVFGAFILTCMVDTKTVFHPV